jgi:hypothetical protein
VIGGQGRLEALSTTEREPVAPTEYSRPIKQRMVLSPGVGS